MRAAAEVEVRLLDEAADSTVRDHALPEADRARVAAARRAFDQAIDPSTDEEPNLIQ